MLTAITALSLTLALAAAGPSFGPVRPAQEGSPTKKVALQRATAVPLKQCQLDYLAAKLPDFTIQRVPRLEDSGIALLESKPGVSVEFADKSVADFLKKNKKWVTVPIIRTEEVEQIPTNRVVVQFKPGATPEQAREIFSTSGLEVLERPSEYVPDRYVFRLTGMTADKVLEASKCFGRNPMVVFSEPIYVLLIKGQ